MITLPNIMVAPNGARRTKADHPAIPETIAQTIEVARACYQAGAGAVHAHVRGAKLEHLLDAGLYRELLGEMQRQVPDMIVQITTEAVGRYTPVEQRQLIADVMPRSVSVSVREMFSDGDIAAARRTYHDAHEADIAVQHIVYTAQELEQVFDHVAAGNIPPDNLQLLFVLGRYTENQQSDVAALHSFLDVLQASERAADWGICAFGSQETACLEAAIKAGGKTRVGFENSMQNPDGSVAKDNVERVEMIAGLWTKHLEAGAHSA